MEEGGPAQEPVERSSQHDSLPDTYTAAAHSDPASSNYQQNDRSCALCRGRKIRCDKRSPCSNCSRADVLCIYPERKKRGRAQNPSSTSAQILARLARVERTIVALSSAKSETIHSNGEQLEMAPGLDESPTHAESLAGEILLHNGSDNTSRYFNETLLASVLKEEQELQSVFGAPSNDDELREIGISRSLSATPLLLSIGGMYRDSDGAYSEHTNQYPTKWQGLQLWQIFVNNVDPVVKILHIPSTQIAIFTSLNNLDSVSKNMEALLFAIFFAAITSMASGDATHLLGIEKFIALTRFRRGLEQALAMGNLLNSPSITSLQAMTIYLTCLRVYDSSRSEWALNGLAIRLAQSLGLHRDGTNFRLPPFEAELRRRLWWYLCAFESRSPEDHGINPTDRDRASDTLLPLNLNDSDLFPDMESLPSPKLKWTEMTFPLIKAEITQRFHLIGQMPRAAGDVALVIDSRRKLVEDYANHLEDSYLKHCDENIPIQRVTVISARLVIAKMRSLVQQQAYQHSVAEPKPIYTEELLATACTVLEMSLTLQSDDLLRGFSWYSRTFVQYHSLVYVLKHLCMMPVGPIVERAWDVVEGLFQIDDESDIYHESGSNWTLLRLLKKKATQVRQSSNQADSLHLDGTGNLLDIVGETDGMGDLPIDDMFATWLNPNVSGWPGEASSFDMQGF